MLGQAGTAAACPACRTACAACSAARAATAAGRARIKPCMPAHLRLQVAGEPKVRNLERGIGGGRRQQQVLRLQVALRSGEKWGKGGASRPASALHCQRQHAACTPGPQRRAAALHSPPGRPPCPQPAAALTCTRWWLHIWRRPAASWRIRCRAPASGRRLARRSRWARSPPAQNSIIRYRRSAACEGDEGPVLECMPGAGAPRRQWLDTHVSTVLVLSQRCPRSALPRTSTTSCRRTMLGCRMRCSMATSLSRLCRSLAFRRDRLISLTAASAPVCG